MTSDDGLKFVSAGRLFAKIVDLREALALANGVAKCYARRAGYLEGGVRIIADGTMEDPVAAAKRLLDGVGEDVLVRAVDESE